MKTRRRPIEFRAAPDEGEGVLIGYASVYDVEYGVGRGDTEVLLRGAFDESVEANPVVPIFVEHDWSHPIGVGRLSSDDHGVRVRAELFVNDNERARSTWMAAEAGAMKQWSIGYTVDPNEIRRDSAKPKTEFVGKGAVLEASVVVKGANPDTEMIEVRSAGEDDNEVEETSLVDQIKALLAQLIAMEASELEGGEDSLRELRALVGVLSSLGWYEELDASDDATEGYYLDSFDDEQVRRIMAIPALRAAAAEFLHLS